MDPHTKCNIVHQHHHQPQKQQQRHQQRQQQEQRRKDRRTLVIYCIVFQLAYMTPPFILQLIGFADITVKDNDDDIDLSHFRQWLLIGSFAAYALYATIVTSVGVWYDCSFYPIAKFKTVLHAYQQRLMITSVVLENLLFFLSSIIITFIVHDILFIDADNELLQPGNYTYIHLLEYVCMLYFVCSLPLSMPFLFRRYYINNLNHFWKFCVCGYDNSVFFTPFQNVNEKLKSPRSKLQSKECVGDYGHHGSDFIRRQNKILFHINQLLHLLHHHPQQHRHRHRYRRHRRLPHLHLHRLDLHYGHYLLRMIKMRMLF